MGGVADFNVPSRSFLYIFHLDVPSLDSPLSLSLSLAFSASLLTIRFLVSSYKRYNRKQKKVLRMKPLFPTDDVNRKGSTTFLKATDVSTNFSVTLLIVENSGKQNFHIYRREQLRSCFKTVSRKDNVR
jgi:hypothetical protein